MALKAIGDAFAAAGYAATYRVWIAAEERAAANAYRGPDAARSVVLSDALDLFHNDNPEIADTRLEVIAELIGI